MTKDIENSEENSKININYTQLSKNKYMPNKNNVKSGIQIYLKSMIGFWLICAIIKIITLTFAIYYNGYTFEEFYNNKNGVLEVSAKLLYGLQSKSNTTTFNTFNYIIYDQNNTIIYDQTSTENCDNCHISVDGGFCNYKQRLQLVAFLLSFFIGECGADWFYLARGNCCYLCGGVGKLLTFGGLMVWWLVDWIRILAETFPDGNHQQLCGFGDM